MNYFLNFTDSCFDNLRVNASSSVVFQLSFVTSAPFILTFELLSYANMLLLNYLVLLNVSDTNACV